MKVRITVHRKETYTDVVEMTKAEFKRLDKELENATGFRTKIKEEIESKIDCTSHNWLDGEVDDVEIYEENRK